MIELPFDSHEDTHDKVLAVVLAIGLDLLRSRFQHALGSWTGTGIGKHLPMPEDIEQSAIRVMKGSYDNDYSHNDQAAPDDYFFKNAAVIAGRVALLFFADYVDKLINDHKKCILEKVAEIALITLDPDLEDQD